MVTLAQTSLIRPATSPKAMLWVAAVAALSTLLALLTMAIMNNPVPSQDVAVMDWIAGADWPGTGTFFGVLTLLTSSKAGLIYGPAGIAFLLLIGKTREALIFAAVGATIASSPCWAITPWDR